MGNEEWRNRNEGWRNGNEGLAEKLLRGIKTFWVLKDYAFFFIGFTFGFLSLRCELAAIFPLFVFWLRGPKIKKHRERTKCENTKSILFKLQTFFSN